MRETESEKILRLLYVVTEDWYFLSHRLPMARAARAAGFEVHVATRVANGAPEIASEGFILHSVPFQRGRLSISASWSAVTALRRLHRSLSPAVCHHVSVQAVVLGSIAALGTPAARVNALTGFGYSFLSRSLQARLIRPIMTNALRFLLNHPRSVALVQNSHDHDEVEAMGIPPQQIALIPGSGVDVDELVPMPEPSGPITAAFVGRLLDDKGIRTLVQAHRLLRKRGIAIELLIAGIPDPANPASVTQQEAQTWNDEPGIHWLGHVQDIRTLWARAHIGVLPSRREGMPKSLLEAAACGRPMVATDVPGCRDIVLPKETGLLVPVDDPAALAAAIETLAESPELRSRYGAAARRLAVERFSSSAIGRQTVDLYRTLMKLATER